MNDYITLRPAKGTWVVRAGGAIIGESKNAIELTEGDAAPVIYFPREDIAMALLDASETKSHCPYKGDAEYFSIVTKSTKLNNAVWSYPAPKAEVAGIAGHLAFYPDKVAVEQI